MYTIWYISVFLCCQSEKEDVPEPAMLLGNNEYVPEYNADLAYPQEVADVCI